MSAQLWNSTQRAVDSFLNNKAATALGGIANPALRSVAGGLLNSVLPGFGGGIPDYRETAYSNLIDKRQQAINGQLTNFISIYKDSSNEALTSSYDWRARLRPKNGGMNQFYSELKGDNDFLLRPIAESGGLIWQYTPSTSIGGSAEYNQTLLHGMNYPINTFINSRPNDITVSSDFTANDVYEARYLLATFIFLRICTKAYFGDAAVAQGTFGTPPPVLLFEYLGDHAFNKVPVVVTNYSISLENEVDYVPVVAGPGNSTVTYVPTKTNISITLSPTYTPHKLRSKFNLSDVTSGKAYKNGFI